MKGTLASKTLAAIDHGVVLEVYNQDKLEPLSKYVADI
jgi:hypothetical protein